MNLAQRVWVGVTAGIILVGGAAFSAAAADDGFTSLFDGHSLKGWDGDQRFWRIENGAIVGQTSKDLQPAANTFLIYRGGEFADFELRFQYKVEGYNSGVQYRSVDAGDYVVTGYQSDFEDRWHLPRAAKGKGKEKAPPPDPNAKPTDTFSGMFFEEKGRMFLGQRGDVVIVKADPADPRKHVVEKIGSVGDPVELEKHIKRGDWNEMIVIARGYQFTHIINGHVMAIGFDEHEAKRRASGILAFQLHRGDPMKIQVKDIRIRPLN